MPVMGVTRFQRFFQEAAGLDVDKDDLKRYSDFLNQKIYDLMVVAEGKAKANDRDVIQLHDLPLTKGVQEAMHQFRRMDQKIELQPLLDALAQLPPLSLAVSEETENRLPAVLGGLSLALARTFKAIDPKVKNPSGNHWQVAFELFDQLL